MFSEEELEGKTLGFDRGVMIPVMASDGRRIDFSSVQKTRMEKKERVRKRWQRKLARQQKGSQNRKKTKTRLSRTFEYAKNVRKDVIHKATRAFAIDPDRILFVVEDLNVKNMTKRPEPKRRRRTAYQKRIPGQGRSEPGDPVVLLGPVRPLPFVQVPSIREARDQGITAIQFARMRPVRAHLSGQPAFPGRVCLPALRAYRQCRSQRQPCHCQKGNPRSSGRESPAEDDSAVRDRKTQNTRAGTVRSQRLRRGR